MVFDQGVKEAQFATGAKRGLRDVSAEQFWVFDEDADYYKYYPS